MKSKSLDIERAKILAVKFREESERYCKLAEQVERRIGKISQGEEDQGKHGLSGNK